MCCAQTGSGKTGAYAIPILNSILKAKRDADELSGYWPRKHLSIKFHQLLFRYRD